MEYPDEVVALIAEIKRESQKRDPSPVRMFCKGLLESWDRNRAKKKDERCNSCKHGFDGTNGNGYQPCSCGERYGNKF